MKLHLATIAILLYSSANPAAFASKDDTTASDLESEIHAENPAASNDRILTYGMSQVRMSVGPNAKV